MSTASIQHDSELMLHLMASQPITSARRFTAVHDEAHRPLLFSITSDNQFVAIKSDGNGSNKIINITAALAIKDPAVAFAVTQSSNANGTLFIAFATGKTNSQLRVFKPIVPADLDKTDNLKFLSLTTNTQPSNLSITNLYLNATSGSTYPLLIAAYTDANGDVNISRVDVMPTAWVWTSDLRIPQIAKGFVDMRAATHAVGDGVFVAYKVSGRTSILFSTTAPGRKTVMDLDVPAGADIGSLGTYRDDDDQTHLLLFGNGLYHLGPMSSSGDEANALSTDVLFKGHLDNAHVTQSGTAVTAWFKTSDLSLAYQKLKSSAEDGATDGPVVPVLSANASAEFSGLIDPASKSQSLVVLNSDYKLSVLEQAVEDKKWNSRPFQLAAYDKTEEVPAYYTHIEVTDQYAMKLCNASFSLSSSAWTTVLVNSDQHYIGTTQTIITTDAKGAITLVTPSDSLSCPKFTLSNAPNSKLLSAPVVIDPSSKAKAKLKSIQTGDDLRNGKTADGTPFLQGSTAKPEDIDRAAKAIKDMQDVLNQDQKTLQANAQAHVATMAVSAKASVSGGGGILQKGWEFFQWIKSKVKSVTDWFVQKAKDVWQFVVTIANEAWTFILDSANAVAHAVSFVFDKIGVAFKSVINFFGWLFNWDDIKATRDSIKLMFNGGFDYITNFFVNNQPVVSTWIDGMEAKLIHAVGLDFPAGIKDQQKSPKDQSSLAPTKSSVSAPANVGAYHFDQAEKAQATVPGASNPVKALYNDIIHPVVDEVSKDLNALAKTIVKLFDSKKSMSMEEIFKQLGRQIINLVFGVFKKIAVGLMKLGADLVSELKSALNADIHIPIITPLLNFLGVPGFSFADAISLILAIPVTVLGKAITGKTPQRIAKFDYKSMVQGNSIPKETLLAYNELASYIDITASVVMTIVKTVKIFTAEAGPPKPFSWASFVFELIVKLCTFPYDRESPAWEYRVAVWSILTGNIIVRAICEKTGLPTAKVTAGLDIVVALAAFSLTQVVHADEFNTSFVGKDQAQTSLSVVISIFQMLSSLGGAYGALVPEPIEKTVAAVVVAGSNAYVSVVKTVKSAEAINKKNYNYLSENV